MNLSKGNLAIIFAVNNGYYVTPHGTVISPSGKILHPNKNQGGYLKFPVYPNSGHVPVMVLVHRLQAYQKFGNELFANKIEVRHLDGNKTNNSYDNIAIGNQFDNARDIPVEKRKHKAYLSAIKTRKLIPEQVYEIRQLWSSGVKQSQLCKTFNISPSGMSRIIRNITYVTI